VNHAERYTSYEGERAWPTTGKGKYLHPSQEAPKAISRLLAEAKPLFDEFVILRYRAANEPPYPFEWVDYQEAWLDYAAALARISSLYQRRF